MNTLRKLLAISFCAVPVAGTHICSAAKSGPGVESAAKGGGFASSTTPSSMTTGRSSAWASPTSRRSGAASTTGRGWRATSPSSHVRASTTTACCRWWATTPRWEGREIAPVSFTSPNGKLIEAWPDYWAQLRDLIDLAYDRYGMRAQITIFADAQLMPGKDGAHRAHARGSWTDVVPGREHKILLLEVANEAWQNGFPGDEGVADLREFAAYLDRRTEIPIAISSNHESGIGLRPALLRPLARTWRPGISAATGAPTTGGSRSTIAGSSATGPGSRPSAAMSRSARDRPWTPRRSRSGW